MKLCNNNTLSAVDDERASRRHRWDLPEVHLLVDCLDVILRAWVGLRRKTKLRLQRLGVREFAFATFFLRVLRLFDDVLEETQLVDARIVFNREVALECALQSDKAAFHTWNVFLMEVVKRIDLNAKEVWVRVFRLDLSERDTLAESRKRKLVQRRVQG